MTGETIVRVRRQRGSAIDECDASGVLPECNGRGNDATRAQRVSLAGYKIAGVTSVITVRMTVIRRTVSQSTETKPSRPQRSIQGVQERRFQFERRSPRGQRQPGSQRGSPARDLRNEVRAPRVERHGNAAPVRISSSIFYGSRRNSITARSLRFDFQSRGYSSILEALFAPANNTIPTTRNGRLSF